MDSYEQEERVLDESVRFAAHMGDQPPKSRKDCCALRRGMVEAIMTARGIKSSDDGDFDNKKFAAKSTVLNKDTEQLRYFGFIPAAHMSRSTLAVIVLVLVAKENPHTPISYAIYKPCLTQIQNKFYLYY